MSKVLKVIRNFLSIFGLLSLLAGGAYVILTDSFSWFSVEKEIHRLPSPNAEYDAVVTTQEPGACGSSLVRLYIVPSGLRFEPKAEGFKWEVFRSHTVVVDGIKWLSDRTLLMTRGKEDGIYHFNPVYYDQRDKETVGSQENWRQVVVLLQTEDRPESAEEQFKTYTFESKGAVIKGRIKIETHYGPPGYGETPEIDRVEKAIILVLSNPIRVIVSGEEHDFNRDTTASEIQLLPSRGLPFEDNEDVSVKGQFFSSHTGRHRRELLMSVAKKM